ncbi:hypothetical protein CPS_4287 [Colwellia psychrerythraea 34H]|uniref:Uncharacterized protein n=1 Tax=Colwellia psychrerythraea (strain 34H / ATCC BAA-681) TaxID=167879 RepID=Q47W85_COLP3|nr:hypothetical protein CPS_4287 [Colwellia psychrerythraea 34H]
MAFTFGGLGENKLMVILLPLKVRDFSGGYLRALTTL